MTNLAKKYDLKVPRYTSYPTAPHFSEAVDGETYGNWLAELDPSQALSLYFHIPFCDEMCWFCGCYTKIVARYDPIAAYMDTLLKEVDLVADALPGTYQARHLHWGGGSPTMLRPEDWRQLIDRLRSRFDVTDDAEIAVELDPRETTEEYVKGLADAGVNRASIGVQDFNDEVQQAINRIQPFDVTKRVIGWLRQHGVTGINMDLMYGLPYQTTERVLDMVDKAVSLEPRRIAIFGYAHVPWMKEHQKMIKEETLPGVEERWEQSETASERLEELGYIRIGFDHFARPDDSLATALNGGSLHRNFQGYTADKAATLIGFGASAIGSLPQGYVQNFLPMKQYTDLVDAGTLPTAKGIATGSEDILRREIIERLMCDMEVDLEEICAHHQADAGQFGNELSRLSPYVEDDICRIDGSRISISENARPFVRLVAAAFDSYLNTNEGRHSSAV